MATESNDEDTTLSPDDAFAVREEVTDASEDEILRVAQREGGANAQQFDEAVTS